jgi:hypothetical protein
VGTRKFGIEPLSAAILPNDVGHLSESELARRGLESRRWYESHGGWKLLARKVLELMETPRPNVA